MLKKVSFNFKGKKVSIVAKNCVGMNRFLGLLFKRKEKADALLFEFRKPVNFRIHSIFVFFPFIAVWLDEKNHVLETRTIKPFTLSAKPTRPYNKFLEIPLNSRYKKESRIFFSRR